MKESVSRNGNLVRTYICIKLPWGFTPRVSNLNLELKPTPQIWFTKISNFSSAWCGLNKRLLKSDLSKWIFSLFPKILKSFPGLKSPHLGPPLTKHGGFWAWIPNEFSSNWSFFWEEWTISVVCDYVSLQGGQACFKRRLKHVLDVAFFVWEKTRLNPNHMFQGKFLSILSLSVMCSAQTELKYFPSKMSSCESFLRKKIGPEKKQEVLAPFVLCG